MIPRHLLLRAVRNASVSVPSRTIRTTSLPRAVLRQSSPCTLSSVRAASHASPTPEALRHMSTKQNPLADEKVEEITELFATAQDEFEIAMEETQKMTVYASDDRQAAREEFDKLKSTYEGIVNGADQELGEEVKRRVGHRVRELEMGVIRMEEMAQEQD